MSEFKPGEIVDITIKGARVVLWHPEISELMVDHEADPNSDRTTFDLTCDQVTVERVAPAEWPPRPGDLWRDRDGDLWFARDVSDDGTAAMWTSGVGKGGFPFGSIAHARLLAKLGPLTLVHREDEQDGDRS